MHEQTLLGWTKDVPHARSFVIANALESWNLEELGRQCPW